MTLYALDCPSCGQQLKPHVGDAQSCPWLCDVCHLGFWVAELQPGTRAHYRTGLHDWGWGKHIEALKAERYAEYVHAFFRGTSAREDQLSILSISQLEHIMTRKKVDPEFMKLVEAEHGRRGVK